MTENCSKAQLICRFDAVPLKGKLLMVNFLMVVLLSLSILSTVAPVAACSFDGDCAPGNRCIKPGGSIYGVCAGGPLPGNRYDRKPVYDPLDFNRTVGDTCRFNADCGQGSKCLKKGGAIYGVCVKRK